MSEIVAADSSQPRTRPAKKLDWLIELCEFVSEFIATLLFAFFGSLAPAGVAAFGNGLALTVLIYCTAAGAPLSGGKLNPVVSMAVYAISFTDAPFVFGTKLIIDCAAQIGGAIAGSALAHNLSGDRVVGCFVPPPGVTQAQVFGLEALATFLLVFTILSTAIEVGLSTRFAEVAPLAIGLSLFTCVLAIGQFTGGSLNPARFLGSLAGVGCKGQSAFTGAYIGGEILGATIAVTIYGMREFLREYYVTSTETEKKLGALPMTSPSSPSPVAARTSIVVQPSSPATATPTARVGFSYRI